MTSFQGSFVTGPYALEMLMPFVFGQLSHTTLSYASNSKMSLKRFFFVKKLETVVTVQVESVKLQA
jgi:hypothetical protein